MNNILTIKELTISFTIFNDGNRIDELEVISVNYEELEDEGFTFISDSFFRASVNPGSSSDQGSIVLMTPSDLDSDLSDLYALFLSFRFRFDWTQKLRQQIVLVFSHESIQLFPLLIDLINSQSS